MAVQKRSNRAGKAHHGAVSHVRNKKSHSSNGQSHPKKRTGLIHEKTLKKWKEKHRREAACSGSTAREQQCAEKRCAEKQSLPDHGRDEMSTAEVLPSIENNGADEFYDKDFDALLEDCLDEVLRSCEETEKQAVEECSEALTAGAQQSTEDQPDDDKRRKANSKFVGSELGHALQRQLSDTYSLSEDQVRELTANTVEWIPSFEAVKVKTETDPHLRDTTAFEARGRRKNAQFLRHLADSSKRIRIRNPHRGVWSIYSSTYYTHWRDANPTQPLTGYPQPGVKVVWERSTITASTPIPHYKRVYILLRVGHLQLCTEMFNLENYVTSKLGYLMQATEVQQQKRGRKCVYDVEIMFLGKEYVRVRVPDVLVQDAIDGGFEGDGRLGRNDGVVFYGRQLMGGTDEAE